MMILRTFSSLEEKQRTQQRKIKEVMESKNATWSKNDFLSKMSHEMRTPMNAIMGMAELALREDLPKSTKEFMFTIIQSSQYLLSIINEIHDISKIDAEKPIAASEEYLLASVINDVVNIIRTKVYDSRLRFTVYVDSNIPNILQGDALKIRQVMLNLLSNAVKFTEKGYISFSIKGQLIEGTVILTIDVNDSGLYDGYAETAPGFEITRNFIAAMNGTIEVHSEPEKGNSYRVTIPQKVLDPQGLASVDDSMPIKVLIFERRSYCRDSIAQSMQNLSVNCELVSTFPEFYNNVMKHDFTHILIPAGLYASIKEEYPDITSAANIALITDFGETASYQDMSKIASPIFCIAIAGFLSESPDKSGNMFDKDEKLIFTAPSARVLIVDDLKTNLVVSEGLLKPYGMQIDSCRSGAEAVKAIRSNFYDLVLMDHMMPIMDGVEATKHIRTLSSSGNSYFHDLPIVAMTANAISGIKKMFLSNGFSDFISKPIDTTRLDAILEAWIPEEKKIRASEAGTIAVDTEESTEDTSEKGVVLLSEIEGMDMNKGISMTGGTFENYLHVLTLFHEEGTEKVAEIKLSLENSDFHLFTTYIHAVKNACAILGADELSAYAKSLELAGSKKDLDYINDNIPVFLSTFEQFLFKIGEALEMEDLDSKKEFVETPKLVWHLEELRDAFADLDMKAISEITEILHESQHDAETDEYLRRILDKKLVGDYDEAVEIIEELLEKLR